MTARLLQRQRGMVEALLGTVLEPRAAADVGLLGLPGIQGSQAGAGLERGMRAYRLNAQALAAQSLGAVFGRLEQILGEDSFAAMAWSFWRSYPPQQGDLGRWGEQLAEFLAAQDGMALSLCDLARLEWAAHCTERAADGALDTESLALLGELEPQHIDLVFRPGVRLLTVCNEAWSLWSGLDGGAGEGAAVTVVLARKAWRTEGQRLQAGAGALMSALHEGANLELALQVAFAAQADFDFSAWLQAALLNAWLLAVERRDPG